MKHLREGRTLTIVLVSGAAASLAAGAFGISTGTSGDPSPIELDTANVQPVAPTPLDDVAEVRDEEPADDGPSTVAPAASTISAHSVATPAAPTAPSVDSPDDPAPEPRATAPVSDGSPDSPDSAPSAGSIDS